MKNKLLIALLLSVVLFSCNDTDYTVYLELENGSGIEPETEIFYKGRSVGNIIEIGFEGTRIIAKSNIRKDFNIPANAKFTIISTDIFGTKAIEIVFDKDLEPYIQGSDTVYCTLNDKTKLDSVFMEVEEIAEKIKDKIDSTSIDNNLSDSVSLDKK